MKFIESVKKMLPGCAIALVIAVVAKFLEQLEESVGLHLIGASVIAMFIGMIVNRFYAPNDRTKPGIKFTSKKILKFAIILLGASLNITTVLTVGKFSLTVMLFTLATCFGLGYVIGKALGLDWKTSSLINAGTGICGGSPSPPSRRSSRQRTWTSPTACRQRSSLTRSWSSCSRCSAAR